jgi:hypothetical protein
LNGSAQTIGGVPAVIRFDSQIRRHVLQHPKGLLRIVFLFDAREQIGVQLEALAVFVFEKLGAFGIAVSLRPIVPLDPQKVGIGGYGVERADNLVGLGPTSLSSGTLVLMRLNVI